ncbi:MAG: glycosyltransferase family 4 protein [Syntrophales bacterium]|jgi:glycosyltransferase involved in cell wall biosynthesis|nr:glycosyltransferase family 4 protein [Syntrophales bacterium]
MRVFMLGWEFPPHISGGLGTACFGITMGLSRLGAEIIFVLPKIRGEQRPSHVNLVSASQVPLSGDSAAEIFTKTVKFMAIEAALRPYAIIRPGSVASSRGILADQKPSQGTGELAGDYGSDLFREVSDYGRAAGVLAGKESFDVIHGHDWMTVPAGIEARQVSGRPYIYHVHSLEFDRSGENVNRQVYDVECYGLENADHIISVSHYTKNVIVNRYGISPDKVTVVHNAVSRSEGRLFPRVEKRTGEKIVLFLGRITFQKGPDYFIEAAARVLEKIPDVTFIMAGAGDMMSRMIERVAELKMGRNFHFAGFLEGEEVERIYAMSDLYVMPSVSEPFGISPLEAMLYDVPVIISKQSGVSEILHHALKVNFWDVNELADKMIGALRHPALVMEMTTRAREELKNIRWNAAAEKILSVYRRFCK